MRLDKFLKISRIVKRRTVANEMAAAGRVEINGKRAKPGAEVKTGDILQIGYGAKQIRVRVLEVREYAKKEEAASLYEILNS
ncbi:MAG TPA: RNA-binding S4 domain-containing protein [Bacillota bacterium]|nr:RNA-binding S4 domain-containing protein [Fastidiosipila sp.]HPX93625.1 RNA-binding S4 domain-containing protein [Bacillota bacterium]HQB81515.1 RNA-binding S4 domain-containing protein [Bacillota bacterium]